MMVMECTPFELLTQGRNMRGEERTLAPPRSIRGQIPQWVNARLN